MKGLPLPPDTPLWLQVVFYGLLLLIGLLFAGILWFIKRYIDKNDDHHKGVEGKLSKIVEDNKSRDDKLAGLASSLKDEALKIEKAATDMKRVQADFSIQINKELLEINKSTGQIKTDLTGGATQVALLKKDIEGLVKTVEGHQASLSKGAQAMVKQRDELANMKTEIVRLSEDLVIIKDKKKKT